MSDVSMKLSLRHIRYIVAAADNGSISGAARACQIAQTSVLAAIDLAEAELKSKRPVEARFQAFSGCQFQGMSSSMRLIL